MLLIIGEYPHHNKKDRTSPNKTQCYHAIIHAPCKPPCRVPLHISGLNRLRCPLSPSPLVFFSVSKTLFFRISSKKKEKRKERKREKRKNKKPPSERNKKKKKNGKEGEKVIRGTGRNKTEKPAASDPAGTSLLSPGGKKGRKNHRSAGTGGRGNVRRKAKRNEECRTEDGKRREEGRNPGVRWAICDCVVTLYYRKTDFQQDLISDRKTISDICVVTY